MRTHGFLLGKYRYAVHARSSRFEKPPIQAKIHVLLFISVRMHPLQLTLELQRACDADKAIVHA